MVSGLPKIQAIAGAIKVGLEAFSKRHYRTAAALLGRSLRNLEHQNFGFETQDRYIAWINPMLGNYKPEQLEPMLAPGGKVSLRDLVEEEVMLSLPIVALHEEAIACNPLGAVAEDDEDRNVQRPFEQLGELLKRSSEASSACEEKDNGRSKKS